MSFKNSNHVEEEEIDIQEITNPPLPLFIEPEGKYRRAPANQTFKEVRLSDVADEMKLSVFEAAY